ncbi:Aste57867_12408 [Aphanomyces stellatus]|uniref:Aste57867_12408 protein n=1 Tax=Aphanomyces stellatus TaxID=120398 RepID=A0A485KW38_9STRA|nr:hypothetical protein As57867_012362 [Aphanomyces stellatus]VFT89259.1 Aste57867_12408 [Aphanomyces stellatus]
MAKGKRAKKSDPPPPRPPSAAAVTETPSFIFPVTRRPPPPSIEEARGTEAAVALESTLARLNISTAKLKTTTAQLEVAKSHTARLQRQLDAAEDKVTTTGHQLQDATLQLAKANTRNTHLEAALKATRSLCPPTAAATRGRGPPRRDVLARFGAAHPDKTARRRRCDWTRCRRILVALFVAPFRPLVLVPFLVAEVVLAAVACAVLVASIALGLALLPLCCCGIVILGRLPKIAESFVGCDLGLLNSIAPRLSTRYASTLPAKAVAYYVLIKAPLAVVALALSLAPLVVAWHCVAQVSTATNANHQNIGGWIQVEFSAAALGLVYVSVGTTIPSIHVLWHAAKYFLDADADNAKSMFSIV